MREGSSYLLRIVYYLSLSYFTYLMILITLQYIPIKSDVAFLNIKQEEITHKYYQIAFFSHVYTSIFVLISGIIQFSKSIRNKLPIIHRISGKLYVFLVLLITSPSGLIMAFHANGGIFSKISFSIQAILWFVFTYKAYKYVKNKEWINHQKFMLRSYALTLSAISLRLFKWIIVSTLEFPPMDTYKIVSWLGWIFNLALVEIYLMNKEKDHHKEQPNNPMHGMKLITILELLVEHYGWERLAMKININCFKINPSIKSSLKFLRKTQWARDKVEQLYLDLEKKK